MMTFDVARAVTERLRLGLAARGEYGRFLLERIDEALAQGMEALQGDPDGRRGKRTKQVISRRAADDGEVLGIHLHVLRAYLIELPDIARSAEAELRNQFGVEEVVLSLATDESRVLSASRSLDIGPFSTIYSHPDTSRLRSELEFLLEVFSDPKSEVVD